uniref:Uncharacterized protein n=1 Tax=Oxyrrhis marina TaxID=2969 RepID=A0A7S4LQC2_OXYMA
MRTIAGTLAGALGIDTLLNEWPMLMTHDAASGYLLSELDPVYLWTVTQPRDPKALSKQLQCGARAFDLRPQVDGSGKLVFHHGSVKIEQDADKALQEIVAFANTNPAEEDLIIVHSSACSGTNCTGLMSEALARAGIPAEEDCGVVSKLTVSEAAAKGKLAGGGHVLTVTDCVDENYDSKLACWGTDGTVDLSAASLAATCAAAGVLLSEPPTLQELVACGEALREPTQLASAVAGSYYSCWTNSSTKEFPIQRLLDSLKGVSAKGPQNGRLWQLQSIWQETPESVVLGVAHFSSLLKDEEHSSINAMMKGLIDEGKTFEKINFFEVNNICDGGPELLASLRAHAARRASQSVLV